MSEIQDYIKKLALKENLNVDEAARVFQMIMKGGVTPAQIAAVLMGLRIKGETVDEITGAAAAMRARAAKIKAPDNVLDTCGTGGDGVGTLNISTAVAFVLAGCGVPVAKHGNKAISSNSGSADVLKELGIKIDVDKKISEKALKEVGICFLFAPKYHESMRHVAPVRQEMGIRTIFNVLGPLTNPAMAKHNLLGVYSKELVLPIANVLKKLGSKKAWVVYGMDGLDEITTTDKTLVAELNNNKIKEFYINPEELGFERPDKADLIGGEPRHNASEISSLFSGKEGAYRDIVVLNSAAALVVAEKAKDIKQGINMAKESINKGKAMEKLKKLVEVTNFE